MTIDSNLSTEQQPAVRISEFRPGILLMTLDTPNKSANILSDSMFAQLDKAITPLLERDELSGLILYSAKPKIFVAGADLVAISRTLDWPDENIIKFCDSGRAVMAKFSQVPFPTVAAIHGACVGGGLELTLWCDGRVVSDDRCSILGLPETKLGLVPGWGGTVRIARICAVSGRPDPLECQLDLVTSGRVIRGEHAVESGFVDDLVPREDLLDAAAKLIERESRTGEFLSDRERIVLPMDMEFDHQALVAKFGATIEQSRDVHPFAPTVALEHMLRSARLPMREACDSESLAMAQVYGSPASYGLINNYFLAEHNRKNPGFVDLGLTPQAIVNVGIVGAGLMGKAIASNHLKRGKTVRILDSDRERAAVIVDELSQSYETISEADDYAAFKDCQLVIECAVENLEIKIAILKQIEAAVSSEAIIATNTSAIPISKMAESLHDPSRFCGLHFCNPSVMSLVEVIRGPGASEQTISTAVGYVRSVGKMPVVVKDRAGFVVNRLLSALLKQAFQLFAEGHAIEEIDGAMREFGFLAGPFEMIDLIGADTCFYAGRSMWEAGLTCVSNSLILPRMVKLGRFGRKVDCGFYCDDSDSSAHARVVDPETLRQLLPYRSGETKPSKKPMESLVPQILAGIVLEATHILEEKIVADFRDIDLCAIHGFSFPAHRGGVLFWADRLGIENVLHLLQQMGGGDSQMLPTRQILEMAQEGKTFYSS